MSHHPLAATVGNGCDTRSTTPNHEIESETQSLDRCCIGSGRVRRESTGAIGTGDTGTDDTCAGIENR